RVVTRLIVVTHGISAWIDKHGVPTCIRYGTWRCLGLTRGFLAWLGAWVTSEQRSRASVSEALTVPRADGQIEHVWQLSRPCRDAYPELATAVQLPVKIAATDPSGSERSSPADGCR